MGTRRRGCTVNSLTKWNLSHLHFYFSFLNAGGMAREATVLIQTPGVNTFRQWGQHSIYSIYTTVDREFFAGKIFRPFNFRR